MKFILPSMMLKALDSVIAYSVLTARPRAAASPHSCLFTYSGELTVHSQFPTLIG